jgi:hypothetical protein
MCQTHLKRARSKFADWPKPFAVCRYSPEESHPSAALPKKAAIRRWN